MRLSLPDPVVRLFMSQRETALTDAADQPSREELDNGRLLNLEAPLTNLALGGAPGFFALFAIQLGASNGTVGWLTSGPALLNLLWLIPCGRLIQRARTYASPLTAAVVFHRLTIMALAVVPFLPSTWRPWGVVALATLSSVPSTMWGLSFHASSGELFSPRHLSRLVGRRWAIGSVTGFISLPLLGKLIDTLPQPKNYQALFFGIGVLTLGSLWMILRSP